MRKCDYCPEKAHSIGYYPKEQALCMMCCAALGTLIRWVQENNLALEEVDKILKKEIKIPD